MPELLQFLIVQFDIPQLWFYLHVLHTIFVQFDPEQFDFKHIAVQLDGHTDWFEVLLSVTGTAIVLSGI